MMDVRRVIRRVAGGMALLAMAAGSAAGDERDVRAVSLLDLKAAPRDGQGWRWDAGSWDGGLVLRLDMGAKRARSGHARQAVCTFQPPRNLAGFEALRVRIQTDRPRSDAQVAIWLGEADGSWYYLKSAVPLADGENEGVCLLEDFVPAGRLAPDGNDGRDEDLRLDLGSIAALAIGVVNPMGVGEVAFKVTSVELINPDYLGPEPAAVTVTGQTLSINGYDKVPAGLFGGCDNHLGQEYRPGCQRNLQAPAYPNVPRQRFVEFGAGSFADWPGMVEALRGESKTHKKLGAHLLGLIDDDRPRGDLARLDVRKGERDPNAAPAELTEVLNRLLRRSDLYSKEAWSGVKLAKGERAGLNRLAKGLLNDTEVMELNRRLLEAGFGKLIAPLARQGPSEAFYIDCFRGLGKRTEPTTQPEGADWKDRLADYGKELAVNARKSGCLVHWEFAGDANADGAKAYGASNFGGLTYDQALAAAASSIKRHNAEVEVIAGWGLPWQADRWAAWEMLVRNTIDRNAQWIDGLAEHHYGGDTTAINGSYEVLAAYAMTKHRKWLYSYCTATNALADAPAKPGAADEHRQMVYNLRDLIYCVGQSPDKVRSRILMHPQRWPAATRVCYGLLKDLRGRLIETRSDDDMLWAVASVDGTDLQGLPDDYDGTQRLVVVLFNDHSGPQQVDLTVMAPAGAELSPASIEWTSVDRRSLAIELLRQDGVPLGKAGITLKLSLEGRSAWKIAIPLKGKVTAREEVSRRQFFSADILQNVQRDKPLRTKIALDAAALRSAGRAWLRLVVEDIAAGEAEVTVGTTKLALPRAHTAEDVNRIVEVPLEVKELKPRNDLTFTVRPGNHAGYRVDMASIVLESRPR